MLYRHARLMMMPLWEIRVEASKRATGFVQVGVLLFELPVVASAKVHGTGFQES